MNLDPSSHGYLVEQDDPDEPLSPGDQLADDVEYAIEYIRENAPGSPADAVNTALEFLTRALARYGASTWLPDADDIDA